MKHSDETLIHDFVDDELGEERHAEVGAHLAECARCRDEADALRDLRRRTERAFAGEGAAAASDDGAGLWPGIEARILASPRASLATRIEVVPRRSEGEPGRARGTRWKVRAVAALAALGLVGTATYFVARATVGGGRDATREAAVLPTTSTARGAEGSFAGTVASAYEPVFPELEAILEEGRGTLAPETVAILETNLAVVNTAIREIQDALAADPAQPEVIRSLDRMYELKVGLLQRAVLLARGT